MSTQRESYRYLGGLACLCCAALLTASLTAARPEEVGSPGASAAAQRGDGPLGAYPPLRDEAAMLVVGAILIGLAAAVRRVA